MRLLAHSLICLALIVGFTGCAEEQAPAQQPEQRDAPAEEQAAPAPQIRTPQDDRTVAARVEDLSTGARVELALAEAGGLRAYAFDAEVTDGRVLRQGDLQTRDEYERAARVARDVDGVTEVVNQVTVAGQEVATAKPEPEPDTATASPDVAEGDTAATPESADEATEQPATAQTAEPQEEQATYHTVRSGESLWTIARQHDVSIADIRQLNNLRGSNIQPGDRLRIK